MGPSFAWGDFGGRQAGCGMVGLGFFEHDHAVAPHHDDHLIAGLHLKGRVASIIALHLDLK